MTDQSNPRGHAMRALTALAFACSLVGGGCASTPSTSQSPTPRSGAAPTFELVLASDVKWEHLNPARGDKSPQAGTLWGDRQGTAPTGFLAKFADGFSSPPHLHNATYRAVVISGSIHNADPQAGESWMPAGSFWTQPKGEMHVTAAKGRSSVALVEIDQGPYLVLPREEAFDSGERAINVHASNLVWVHPPGAPPRGSKLAYLWGSLQAGQSNGTFVKLPPGVGAKIHSHGVTRVVVIEGTPSYHVGEVKTLPPGSYLGSSGEAVHEISSSATQESVLYVRTEGSYELTESRP